ncbi:uncharacterized protein MELLADRAFT_109575 [Melampsora larici-populina 98AG31]|uniref:Uncharacterized protein n=1 Tax=Melampsora larici-populina (strain 98AG31 / pathotype 3-4-7) TaxID=747676 RepID=F4RWX7_MELLP|nr:uncharacterized protein MELLADRAFT_109575 [Melampsora larici-populina 98AG31]EGG03101.1 hypothetical protein MELLADRAFT_109575 [Melampsora larici-populina 98AG31]
MSSDSNSHTSRGESVAPHSSSLQSNSPSHQHVMSDLLPDSPQSDQLQDVNMPDIQSENSQELSIDSLSSVRFSSEESIIEHRSDSQDQSMEQPMFLAGSHALNECKCFDPVSPIEYESESDSRPQSVDLENMILFRDEASPGFLDELSQGISDSSDFEPARPLRRVELGHDPELNLADPTLLTPRRLWRYIHGEVDALGNPRSPTSIELHKIRQITPDPLSSDSSTSSEEEERSIRELLIPADRSLNRSSSIDTEGSLEYLPAIESGSDHQNQSIQSRPPTPGPGWSDGIEVGQMFDSRGSPLTSDSSDGEELSSTQDRSALHHYARLVERQPTPGPSHQQSPNSGNPHSLSPETLRLWRLGFVDARGRRSPHSMRHSSPCLGPSSRNVSVGDSDIATNSPRDEVSGLTQNLETVSALKPKGKKRKNQATDSPLPPKKKTKPVKKSTPSKKREEPQAQLTDVSCTIISPAMPPTPTQPQAQPIPSSQTRSSPALPTTPPKPQDQPSGVSRAGSQPARPETLPEPQAKGESSPPQIQAQAETQMEGQAQRPVRALRPRRLDGRAATDLRARSFEVGIDSNQNKKKRGVKKTQK